MIANVTFPDEEEKGVSCLFSIPNEDPNPKLLILMYDEATNQGKPAPTLTPHSQNGAIHADPEEFVD